MVQRLPDSERRWLRALLILGTVAVGFVLLGLVANVVLYFSDILIILILAWLFAFMVSPIVSGVLRAAPSIPRTVVVVSVYALLFIALVAVLGLIVGTLATSIANFVQQLPSFQQRLPEMLAPWQSWLSTLGIQVDLKSVADQAVVSLQSFAGTLTQPILSLAGGMLGALGNLLVIVFLSLFIVIDKDKIAVFVNRMIPPRWSDEANLFQQSVSASFGGFLRGQAIQGLIYGAVAAIASLVLNLPYVPVTTVAVAVLQMIPFFGPFVSWAPPVLAALVAGSPALLPIFVIMWIGWFVVMNFLQPRLMEATVGIHPVGVLVSVLLGLKLAGVIGAILAIPVASVISTFFFYYLQRSTLASADVTTRAALRVGQREGRRVRVPKSPDVTSPDAPVTDVVLDPTTLTPTASEDGQLPAPAFSNRT